ncbi:MAG: hypothetical protein ACE5JE_05930 [Thermoplasmata archaeon]
MSEDESVNQAPALLRPVLIALVFFAAFIIGYLSTIFFAEITPLPPNPRIGGSEGLLFRPEAIVVAASLAFGWPAILGTTAGVLVHNLAFRLVPEGVTLAFALLQTLVVLVGTYAGFQARGRVRRPFNNLAATWIVSALLIVVLGTFAAVEYGTAVLEEWWHIFLEVFLPINIIGLAFLELIDWRRRPGVRVAATES